MDMEQSGWVPDYTEDPAQAGHKRTAARTPGSGTTGPSTPGGRGGPIPVNPRKARKGLDEDFGQAGQQDQGPQRHHYDPTVLEEDEYEQTYLEVYPSDAETNPQRLCYTSPSRILAEIRMKALSHGVHHSKFLISAPPRSRTGTVTT